MMATPSDSPTADADNIKDEDAGETKEDDNDGKMLGTNDVRRLGATPAAPTTPILVPGRWIRAYSLLPNTTMLLRIMPHPTTTKGISCFSTYSNSSRP